MIKEIYQRNSVVRHIPPLETSDTQDTVVLLGNDNTDTWTICTSKCHSLFVTEKKEEAHEWLRSRGYKVSL